MAISFVAAEGHTHGEDTAFTITKPTGTAEGDLMIVVVTAVGVNVGAPTFATVGGWTQLDTEATTTGDDGRCSIYYRVAGGNEPSSYVGSRTQGGSNSACAVVTASYRGVDNLDPFIGFNLVGGTNPGTLSSGTVSNTDAGAWAVGVAGGVDDSPFSLNRSSGDPTTNRGGVQSFDGGGTGDECAMTGLWDSNGVVATGSRLFIASESGTTDWIASGIILLRPGVNKIVTPIADVVSAENGPNETGDKLYDGIVATKWLAFEATATLQYELAAARIISDYTLSSANDDATRDPRDWQFQGSNDASTWTTLHTVTDETFDSRFLTKRYSVPNASIPYLYYRLNITENNGNGSITQLADFLLYSGTYQAARLAPSVITSSGDFPPNETDDKVADEDPTTKWLVGSSTGWVAFELGSAATVRTYKLTSANDFPDRDPHDWQFQGSSNGTNWTTLDTRTDEPSFASRFLTQSYTVADPGEYLHYRLNVTAINGGSFVQLAEFIIYEAVNPLSPAAGAVSATVSVSAPTVSKASSSSAGVATVSVTANVPSVVAVSQTSVDAGAVSATVSAGVAATAKASVSAAPLVSGSAVANAATVSAVSQVSADAQVVSVTGSAGDAGVTVSASTDAAAGLVSASVSAGDATTLAVPQVTVGAGATSASASAGDATVAVVSVAQAGHAPVLVGVSKPIPVATVHPATPSASVSVEDAEADLDDTLGLAEGVTVGTSVHAGSAALGASSPSVSAGAEAFDATVSSAGSTSAGAGTATVSVAAEGATGSVRAAAGSGQVDAEVHDVAVLVENRTAASAGPVSISGAAVNSGLGFSVGAGTVSASVGVGDATVSSTGSASAPAGIAGVAVSAAQPAVTSEAAASPVTVSASTEVFGATVSSVDSTLATAGAVSATVDTDGASSTISASAGTSLVDVTVEPPGFAGTANAPAGSATVSATADDVTVGSAGSTSAAAGAVSASAAADGAGVPRAPLASAVSGTAVTHDAAVLSATSAHADTVTVSASADDAGATSEASTDAAAGLASATVSAFDATSSTSGVTQAPAGTATVSTGVEDATVDISGSETAPSGVASGSVTVFDPLVASVGSTEAPAGLASATVGAGDGTGHGGATASTTTGATEAFDATVVSEGVSGGPAGDASGTVTTGQPMVASTASPGTSGGAVEAFDATVSSVPAVLPPAGAGSATATANNPMIVITSGAGAVLATVSAEDALAVLAAAAEAVGDPVATAFDAVVRIGMVAGSAAASADADAAIVERDNVQAPAGRALASVGVSNAGVSNIQPTPKSRTYRV